MRLSLKDIGFKFLFFTIILLILFCLWLPLAGPYLWLRLKVSYLLLNLFGFYPKFVSPAQKYWSGELFSFLPFLALMITTYKKQIIKHWKYIVTVFFVLVLVEIMGRFFSEITVFYPKSNFINPIAIFLLATARPALPFLFWFYKELDENKGFTLV